MIKILTFYSLIVFYIVAFLNPILNYVFIGAHSLQSLLLMPYVIIVLILLIKNREKYFITAISVSLIFIFINLMPSSKRGDDLLIFYTLAFFSNGIIGEKYIGKFNHDKLLNLLFFSITAGIIHSFGLAFGLWGSNSLNADLIGQRIGSSGDIIDIIPFTIPFLFFYIETKPKRLLKLLAYFAILLGILRLIATGTRGITFSVLISVAIYLFYFHFSFRKIRIKNIIKALTLLIILTILSKTLFINQTTQLARQYIEYNLDRGGGTGIARIVEAKNDFYTFSDNPFFGAGFNGAAKKYNDLGESSAGHFFLTGLLARVGLFGTLFFLLAYFFYFVKMYKIFKIAKTTRYFVQSTLIIVITYFILGNPLYLSQVWFVLPIFWGIIINYSKNEKITYPLS